PAAPRLLRQRRGALCAAGEQADPRGARALPAVSRGRAAAAHRDQGGDRAGPDRARRMAESGGVVGKASASATPAIRARGDGAIARRDHAGVVISSEPPEYEHQEAHAGDVARRVQEGEKAAEVTVARRHDAMFHESASYVSWNVSSWRLATIPFPRSSS